MLLSRGIGSVLVEAMGRGGGRCLPCLHFVEVGWGVGILGGGLEEGDGERGLGLKVGGGSLGVWRLSTLLGW